MICSLIYFCFQVKGDGEDLGATFFVPKDVDIESSKKNRDYYTRVKALIQRVLEKRNPSEEAAADAYTSMLEDLEKEAGVPPPPQPKTSLRRAQFSRRATRRTPAPHLDDVSWKDSSFPKTSNICASSWL